MSAIRAALNPAQLSWNSSVAGDARISRASPAVQGAMPIGGHRLMKPRSMLARALCAPLLLLFASAPLQVAHADPPQDQQHENGFYQQHNLASDGFVAADHPDSNLVNAWGLALNPFGVAWVADNGQGVSTLYDGDGNPQSLVVQIPTPDADTGGNPTGIVYNGSNAFTVTVGTKSGPSRFIFATEDGVIAAWAPTVDGTHAIKVADNSVTTGAIYKGIALSGGGEGQLLYATDFFNARVDVFDATFQAATLPAGAFVDPAIPSGFAPFGIQAINGNVYVTYAQQDTDKEDDVSGPGLGYVDVFDPNGVLLHRVASRGVLNAPWGIALAPAGFGNLSNALLIGNFGDGTINAFDPVLGRPLGSLRGADHKPIRIEGLWGIAFGNGIAHQPVNTLFFAAGPDDEAHGLYGRIDAVAAGTED
jgi:uncharacterized protein (TIGR03118 family)